MLSTLDDCIGKRCLIGLSYFDLNGQLLKQNLIAGDVIKADKENGITLNLIEQKQSNNQFIIPADLSCWFIAPKGDFHTQNNNITITDPDYLVTWDIHQTKQDIADGEQQWWEWLPNTQQPNVGGKN